MAVCGEGRNRQEQKNTAGRTVKIFPAVADYSYCFSARAFFNSAMRAACSWMVSFCTWMV